MRLHLIYWRVPKDPADCARRPSEAELSHTGHNKSELEMPEGARRIPPTA